jgi:hypothetical protein
MQIAELREVVVDTTVQEKAATFPTDAKLLIAPACGWCGCRRSMG